MEINRKTVARYMREMGIAAIYPGPNLSKRNQAERMLRRYLESVRCPTGLPAIGSDQERELLLVGIALTTKGQPTKVGITQWVAQRTVQRLGQQAAHQPRAEAQRERNITRREYLQNLARRLETITPRMLRHSLARRMLERGAQLPEVQPLSMEQSQQLLAAAKRHKLGRWCVLEEKAGAGALHRLAQIAGLPEHRQDEDFAGWQLCMQCGGGGNAIAARHLDIQQSRKAGDQDVEDSSANIRPAETSKIANQQESAPSITSLACQRHHPGEARPFFCYLCNFSVAPSYIAAGKAAGVSPGAY